MNETGELSGSERSYFSAHGEGNPTSGENPAMTDGPSSEARGPSIEQRAERASRQVPYGALAEERARRKELQRQIDEIKARTAGGADSRTPKPMAAGATDSPWMPADLPQSAVLDGNQAIAEGAQEELTDGQAGSELSHASRFGESYVGAVKAFTESQPDFIDAYKHATMDRARELIELGYLPSEAMQIVAQNELEIVQRAMAQGRNPGEVIYNLALRRGYKRPGTQSGSTSGPNEAERVALAARGQAGAKSLSNAAGGMNGSISLEALAQMSDDEFASVTKGERWEKMMR
jgi:hypothetical protein